MRKKREEASVVVTADVFGEENATLADMLRAVTGAENPRVLLVADMNVVHRTEGLGLKIGRYVKAHGITLTGSPVAIAGGEKIKSDNLQSAMRVASAALAAKVGAGDAVVALGGGTLMDVAGWAAAQVRGGVRVVRVPTTPAAMLDAAYATHAALDSTSVKDALRVPCPAAGVAIDPAFAATVVDGVWRGGLGEALRHAAALDASLFKKLAAAAPALRDRDAEAFAQLVADVSASRAKKGTSDFALWCAARLEGRSGYKVPHGYAVATGILVDTAYAQLRGLLKEADRAAICAAMTALGTLECVQNRARLGGDAEDILFGLDAWRLQNGTGEITLPTGLGKSVAEVPDRETMRAALDMVK